MQAPYDAYAVQGDPAARRILSVNQIDALGEAILALTGELWILTDRLAVLEEVLKSTGVDIPAAIDAFVPPPSMERVLDERRNRLITTVVGALQTVRGDVP